MRTHDRARIALAAVALTLAACAGGPPAIILDTAAGPVPLNNAASAELAGPPPGIEPAAFFPTPGAGLDGTYAGTADVLTTDGGLCIQNLKVKDFRVRGNAARYGGYRGRIEPDGGLQMVYGQDWIIGQFEGATFHGQIEVRGRFDSPGCSYLLSLVRVGP